MRYKKKMTKEVKSIAEYHLRSYEANKRALSRYRRDLMPSNTPDYSGIGGSHNGESRPVERLAVEIATDRYIFQLEESTAAVEEICDKLRAQDRRLVELVYWRRSYTVRGAAEKLHMDTSTAYDHLNSVLYDIAVLLGYIRNPE